MDLSRRYLLWRHTNRRSGRSSNRQPTQLIADIILDCTAIGDTVLDPFLGSGTTLLAAEQTKRRGIGIELDMQYVDVAIRRLQETHGMSAIHAETGLSFEDLKTERLSQKEAAHV